MPKEKAIKKILGKCGVEGSFLGIFTKGRYKGRELSVFRTGKLIIKGLKEKKEAEEIAKKATYFDLSTDALGEFTEEYINAMFIPHQNPDRFSSVEKLME